MYPIENYALSLGIQHDSCWGHEDGNYAKASPFLNRYNLDQIKRESQFQLPNRDYVLVQASAPQTQSWTGALVGTTLTKKVDKSMERSPTALNALLAFLQPKYTSKNF